jgi:quercetin dioxygenase-like cupin family protein
MSNQNQLHVVAWAVIAALTSSAVGTAKDARPAAAQEPQAKRTIIERHDQAGVPGKEIVLGTAEFPRGAVIGWHVHAGDEAGYVVKGTLVLKTRGQPDRTLKAGDTFFNPKGAVHSLMSAPDTDGGAVFSTWVVDKDKPLAEPVK